MYTTCSLNIQQRESSQSLEDLVHSNETFPTNTEGTTITNGMMLAIVMNKSPNNSADRPINIQTLQIAEGLHLTTADCTVTTSDVEAQVLCNGNFCRTSAKRLSTLPHNSTNLTVIELLENQRHGSSQAFWTVGVGGPSWSKSPQLLFLSPLINATTPVMDSSSHTSAFEHYFVEPGAPFSAVPQLSGNTLALYHIGNLTFSHRLTQLFNTMWLSSAAPYALTGNFTSPSNHYYGVSTVGGTTSKAQTVLHCDNGWLAILVFASCVMLAAGVGTAMLDASRRGPDVLSSFAFALRDNKYVRSSLGPSMDDNADMAKRKRNVRVRFGDVHPDEDIGHVAIATSTDSETIEPLRKGRLYT